jgi:hypothetical protein
MDARRWALRGLLAGTAVACGYGLLHIEVEDTASTAIPKGTIFQSLIADLGFAGFTNLDIVASEELQNQGVQPGDISSARFEQFTLTVTAPSGGDLSFLESIDFYVEAPGLDRILFASGTDFPAGVASVDLDLEDVDLVDYVVSDSMTITTEANGHQPEADTTVEARFVMDVGVTGQGACNAIKRSGPQGNTAGN